MSFSNLIKDAKLILKFLSLPSKNGNMLILNTFIARVRNFKSRFLVTSSVDSENNEISRNSDAFVANKRLQMSLKQRSRIELSSLNIFSRVMRKRRDSEVIIHFRLANPFDLGAALTKVRRFLESEFQCQNLFRSAY